MPTPSTRRTHLPFWPSRHCGRLSLLLREGCRTRSLNTKHTVPPISPSNVSVGARCCLAEPSRKPCGRVSTMAAPRCPSLRISSSISVILVSRFAAMGAPSPCLDMPLPYPKAISLRLYALQNYAPLGPTHLLLAAQGLIHALRLLSRGGPPPNRLVTCLLPAPRLLCLPPASHCLPRVRLALPCTVSFHLLLVLPAFPVQVAVPIPVRCSCLRVCASLAAALLHLPPADPLAALLAFRALPAICTTLPTSLPHHLPVLRPPACPAEPQTGCPSARISRRYRQSLSKLLCNTRLPIRAFYSRWVLRPRARPPRAPRASAPHVAGWATQGPMMAFQLYAPHVGVWAQCFFTMVTLTVFLQTRPHLARRVPGTKTLRLHRAFLPTRLPGRIIFCSLPLACPRHRFLHLHALPPPLPHSLPRLPRSQVHGWTSRMIRMPGCRKLPIALPSCPMCPSRVIRGSWPPCLILMPCPRSPRLLAMHIVLMSHTLVSSLAILFLHVHEPYWTSCARFPLSPRCIPCSLFPAT